MQTNTETSSCEPKGDDKAQLIQLAQNYMDLLQTGEYTQAIKAFNELRELHCQKNKLLDFDQGLYQEIGKLTRELHESINDFMQDLQMQTLMKQEIPDARLRLNHIIELTEKSAHKTLNAIENSNPIVTVMQKKASKLQQDFNRCMQVGDNNKELGDLAGELDEFLRLVTSDAKKVADDLNEILMAQSTQDLAGQVIQRVITLVQKVEKNMLALLQFGVEESSQPDVKGQRVDENNKSGFGPAVPGIENGDILQSQEDVDDLLLSLGF